MKTTANQDDSLSETGRAAHADSGGADAGHADAEAGPDLRALARDWVTLWESELVAIAADREAQEIWWATVSLWSGLAAAMLAALPRGAASHDHAPPAAPGPAPSAAAPDTRDAEIERLSRHIDALERRLAELERGRGDPRRPGRRKR